MKYCCVPDCKDRKSRRYDISIKPNVSHIWLERINNDKLSKCDKRSLKSFKICGIHFEEACKYPNGKLKAGAVPTLHLPSYERVENDCLLPSSPKKITKFITPEKVKDLWSLPTLATGKSPIGSVKNVSRIYTRKALFQPDLPSTSTDHGSFADISPPPIKEEDSYTSKIVHVDTSSRMATKGDAIRKPKRESLIKKTGILKPKKTFSKTEGKLFKEAIRLQKRVMRLKQDKVKCSLNYADKLCGKEEFRKLCENLSPIQVRFFESQLLNCTKRLKGRHFTFEQKADAIAIWKSGPKTYRVLSKMFILPSISTLKAVLNKVQITPGISKPIFNVLKRQLTQMKVEDANKYSVCSLLFDEMAIKPHLDYLPHEDYVVGFEDDGVIRTNNLADHVSVFMLRGVFNRWKQPVAFAFTKSCIKAETIKRFYRSIVKEATEAGLNVIASICDQGSTNLKAIRELIEETKRDFILQGVEVQNNVIKIDNHTIIPLFDPPHLVKSFRNNLLKKDVHFESNSQKMRASWSHIVMAYNIDKNQGPNRLMKKISDRHVVPNKINKMKVSICTQVFSGRVASFLNFASGAVMHPLTTKFADVPIEGKETMELVRFMDNFFDSLNGGFGKSKGKPLRGLVDNKSPHKAFWIEAKKMFFKMRFEKRNRADRALPPCLSGSIKTLNGFLVLKKTLKNLGYDSFPARAFNQDPLENFFGQVRQYGGLNINPTCKAFIPFFKSLLVRNFYSYQSPGANCESDSDSFLITLRDFLQQPPETRELSDVWHPPNVDLDVEINYYDANLVSYVGGFLLKNVLPKSQDCEVCLHNLEHDGDPDDFFHKMVTLREYDDVRRLRYMNISLIKKLMKIYCQLNILIPSVFNNHNIVQRVTSYLLSFTYLDFEECPHSLEIGEKIIQLYVKLYFFSYLKKLDNIISGKELPQNPNDIESEMLATYKRQRHRRF